MGFIFWLFFIGFNKFVVGFLNWCLLGLDLGVFFFLILVSFVVDGEFYK